jgi:hypothetical protein
LISLLLYKLLCFQRFDPPFQFLMLKRLLGELDNVLGRPDADVLPFAIQVFHQRSSRFAEISLETIQRPLYDRVPLAFKVLAEGFFLEAFIDRGLIDLGAGKPPRSKGRPTETGSPVVAGLLAFPFRSFRWFPLDLVVKDTCLHSEKATPSSYSLFPSTHETT